MDDKLSRTIQLVKKAKNGDQEAFNSLFERYYDRVIRIARLRLGSLLRAKLETQDICQEVFIKVIKSFEQFNEFETEGAFLHWVSKIIENTIRDKSDYFKAKKRSVSKEVPLKKVWRSSEGTQEFTLPGNEPAPFENIQKKEEARIVEESLFELKEEEKEIIIMAEYEGLKYTEIGEKLTKSPDAIRMMHNRIIAKLTLIMEKKYNQ